MDLEAKTLRQYNELTHALKRKMGKTFMYSDTLARAGKQTIGPKFLGVYPKGVLDYSRMNPGETAIINTQGASEPGEHWCGVGCNSKDQIVVYDSFGRKGAGLLGIDGAIDTDLDVEQHTLEVNCGPRSLAWCVIFNRNEKNAMLI